MINKFKSRSTSLLVAAQTDSYLLYIIEDTLVCICTLLCSAPGWMGFAYQLMFWYLSGCQLNVIVANYLQLCFAEKSLMSEWVINIKRQQELIV